MNTPMNTPSGRAAPASGEASPPPAEERRREIFTILANVTGQQIDGLTKSARGALNRAASELRDVNATAGEVKRRALAYRARFPQAALTATALAKHWAALADFDDGGLCFDHREPTAEDLAAIEAMP